ncbi:MAG: CoA pyrophosphatase [Deltaproteobacteria bacterium]|nr:CoA pyrophosphatase [Deltaproteobacteria bacterium]
MNESAKLPNIGDYLERLRLRLQRVDTVERPQPGTELKTAAVLVPLLHREGELHVLYTRRSDHLASHRGEVAFPGGRFDWRDAHLLAAALREANEEVGIEPQAVEVLGSFEGRRTHSTHIMVTPFVGMIHGTPDLRPDPKEVAEIFEVPLCALADPRYRGVHRWHRNGTASIRPAILYQQQVIWGLTYELTMRFLELILLPPNNGNIGRVRYTRKR